MKYFLKSLFYLGTLLSMTLISSCSSSNVQQNYIDSDFSTIELKEKNIKLIPVQVFVNNLVTEKLIKIFKENEYTNLKNIDVDAQHIIGATFNTYLDLFETKYLEKDFIFENNNNIKNVFPVVLRNERYQLKIDPSFVLPQAFKNDTDYLLVPVALKLDAVDNINSQFKTEDLQDPGIVAIIDYALYRVADNKVVMSGSVSGITSKSGLLQKTLGRDEIRIVLTNAAEKFVELFY